MTPLFQVTIARDAQSLYELAKYQWKTAESGYSCTAGCHGAALFYVQAAVPHANHRMSASFHIYMALFQHQTGKRETQTMPETGGKTETAGQPWYSLRKGSVSISER